MPPVFAIISATAVPFSPKILSAVISPEPTSSVSAICTSRSVRGVIQSEKHEFFGIIAENRKQI